MSYAKTSPPELPDVFERTRLFRLLDQFCSRRAVWVQGLAGAGKTTLVASYLKRNNLPTLWYRLDENDADPATFFHYLNHAAAPLLSADHRPLPKITTEVLARPIPFSSLYFRELFHGLPESLVVVFDNFHVLPPDEPLAEALLAMPAEVPGKISVIFISRTSPPSILSRMLINRTLAILAQDALRLTDTEVEGLARLWVPEGIQPDTVTTLNSIVDGWIAGLVLLLERGAYSSSNGSVGSEYFFDYFASQIFDTLSDDLKHFLLQTASLNTMPLTVVRKLTGIVNSREILDNLCERHYFTSKNDQSTPVYQYHPLFHEFLRNRARTDLGHKAFRYIIARAADILAKAGRTEEAIEMAIDAADWQNAGKHIHRLAPILLSQQRMQILEQWLRQLPPDLFDSLPWLYYWYGCCRRPMHQQESIRYFSMAYDAFDKQKQKEGMLLSASGAILSIFTEWDDFRPLDPWIQAVEELLTQPAAYSSVNEEALVTLAVFGALLFRKPQHSAMGYWEARARQLIMESDLEISLRIDLGNVLGHYQFWQGDLAAASHSVDILIQLVEAGGSAPLPQIFSAMNQAILHWHTADFDHCLSTIDRALAASAELGVHIMDDRLMAQSVYASLAREDLPNADRFLNRMKPSLQHGRRLTISHYHYLRSSYYLIAGDLEMARHHARIAVGTNREVGAPYPEALARVTLAQISFDMGDATEATELLLQADRFSMAMGSRTLELLTAFTSAWFALQYDKTAALSQLQHGLSVQRQTGFINFPGWCNRLMKPLLLAALQHNIEADFVRILIRRHNLHVNAPFEADEKWPWPVKIHTMGRFSLLLDDKPLQFTTKAQQKPLELLKAIISFGGREVGKNKLTDYLWPDTDGDKAMRALDTTLHRLRKLIGFEQIIQVQDRKLGLNPQLCWLDTWALENVLMKLETFTRQTTLTHEDSVKLQEQIFGLYQGEFLGNDDEPDCIIHCRERWHNTLMQRLSYLGANLEHHLAWQEAAILYQNIIEIDDCQEQVYQRLIVCYQQLNRIGDARTTYERCRRALANRYGIEPSAATETLHNDLC